MNRRRAAGLSLILGAALVLVSLWVIATTRPDILVPIPPVADDAGHGGAAPRILWSAGMEQGNLDEWDIDHGGGKFNTGPADAVASRDLARTGQWATKMAIPGDAMAATRLFRWKEARERRELFYSAWYFVPVQYRLDPGGWANWFQFKSRRALLPWKHDPIFLIGWRNVGPRSAIHLVLAWWQGLAMEGPGPGQHGGRSWESPIEIPIGRWFHLEARYVCAGDFTGAVQVWQDGVEIFNLEGVKTRHAIADCRWAVNNYGEGLSPRPVVIYLDDAVISTARLYRAHPAREASDQ